MIADPLLRLQHLARRFLAATRARVAQWTRPIPLAVAVGAAADATRTRSAWMCQDSDEGWWDRSYSGSVGALVATRRRTMCPVCTAPRPRRWNSPAAPPSASARSAAVDAAGSALSGQEHRSTTSRIRLTSCYGSVGSCGDVVAFRSCYGGAGGDERCAVRQ